MSCPLPLLSAALGTGLIDDALVLLDVALPPAEQADSAEDDRLLVADHATASLPRLVTRPSRSITRLSPV